MSEAQVPTQQTAALLSDLQSAIGFQFQQSAMLEQALTHKSFANEKTGSASRTSANDNERLEFLGDAVLDLALTAALMNRFPLDAEGVLSKRRASLVNEESLARLASELKLDSYLRLGKGELKTGGLQKPRLLASALEALFGAVFLDSGFNAAATVIETVFARLLGEIGQDGIDFGADFKTRLQEQMQDIRRTTPVYQVESEAGPDHDKQFTISVRIDGQVLATGTGKSKKAAEQAAARNALELNLNNVSTETPS